MRSGVFRSLPEFSGVSGVYSGLSGLNGLFVPEYSGLSGLKEYDIKFFRQQKILNIHSAVDVKSVTDLGVIAVHVHVVLLMSTHISLW